VVAPRIVEPAEGGPTRGTGFESLRVRELRVIWSRQPQQRLLKRKAIESTGRIGLTIVGLLGKDGGRCRDLVDLAIIAPAQTSDRIQEIHVKVIHIAIEGIERRLFPDLY
jgi:hypothetical protein